MKPPYFSPSDQRKRSTFTQKLTQRGKSVGFNQTVDVERVSFEVPKMGNGKSSFWCGTTVESFSRLLQGMTTLMWGLVPILIRDVSPTPHAVAAIAHTRV